ncbi:MAG: gliding motility protein GldN [Flavobacteriia bacterium]|jgi:gliding motility associated protien GldN|nr:gliding motility protein GldN [Cryomorphaceae bacterium]
MKSIFVITGLSLISFNLLAQPDKIEGGPVNVPADGIVDGVFIQQHIPTKRMIPYEYVREADMIWSKRVWQYIDLREKINLPMYFPKDEVRADGVWVRNSNRWSLWTVIREYVFKGELQIFAPFDPLLSLSGGGSNWDGDQLKYPIDMIMPGETDSAYQKRILYYFGTEIKDPNAQPLTDEFGDPLVVTDTVTGVESYVYPPAELKWYNTQDVVQYRIKEDWFFDKERSVLDVRIIAIAPVIQETTIDANGNKSFGRMRELFWLYFPHCRFVFNNYFVYNDQNDAQWMSFDDLFWKRRFNSTIYKESNTFDRNIESYRMGVDALMEAEKIKEEIRVIEHDVWSF